LEGEEHPDLGTYENGSASRSPTYSKPQFPLIANFRHGDGTWRR